MNKQHYSTQKRAVAAAFYERPKTMLMVAKETDILRANICRYVAKMRANNNIFFVKKGICEVSNHPGVGYYTTNSNLLRGGRDG